jgi:hypothetical protein
MGGEGQQGGSVRERMHRAHARSPRRLMSGRGLLPRCPEFLWIAVGWQASHALLVLYTAIDRRASPTPSAACAQWQVGP